MVQIRRRRPSAPASNLLETLVTAQLAYPEQTTFQCYNKFFATKQDPFIEHVGLAGGSLDNVNLTHLDELALDGSIGFLQPTVHLGWDQRFVGGEIELRPRDTGARELPFRITPHGMAQAAPPRTGRIRDLIDWQPGGWGWPGSVRGFDKTRPNVATARIKSASVTRDGVEIWVNDGDQVFDELIHVQNVREREPIARTLNAAPGANLEAAGDLMVE
jgi:hypothetical protein